MTTLDSKLDSCPTAPAQRTTVHTRVLHRACEKLGGVAALARFLNVPPATVYRWIAGEIEPPADVFLRAVDIVMPAWSDEDEALARARLAGRGRPPFNRKD